MPSHHSLQLYSPVVSSSASLWGTTIFLAVVYRMLIRSSLQQFQNLKCLLHNRAIFDLVIGIQFIIWVRLMLPNVSTSREDLFIG